MEEKIMEDIKRCPFCGGKAELRGEKRAYILCTRCNTRSASFRFIIGDEASEESAKSTAIRLWNSRVNEK
jgi:tRNA(Ile2) C34 agmatinyltransferase TiaS